MGGEEGRRAGEEGGEGLAEELQTSWGFISLALSWVINEKGLLRLDMLCCFVPTNPLMTHEKKHRKD